MGAEFHCPKPQFIIYCCNVNHESNIIFKGPYCISSRNSLNHFSALIIPTGLNKHPDELIQNRKIHQSHNRIICENSLSLNSSISTKPT